MESPSGTYAAHSQLFDEVGRRMHTEVEFVQRRTSRFGRLAIVVGLSATVLAAYYRERRLT